MKNFFLITIIFLLLISSLYILLTKNSILAIFALLSSAISLSLLMILVMGAKFVPIILIIVYCGAIIILFMFLVTIVYQTSPEKLKGSLCNYTLRSMTILIGSLLGGIISIFFLNNITIFY
jgi:NADH:ubiquinone oxidoreductase subunit 6 (subunit J)